MTDSPSSVARVPAAMLPSPFTSALPKVGTAPLVASWRQWALSTSWLPACLVFLYSAFLALGAFALNGRYGLNLADEGYLRYGVHAILSAGQVPIRDFQAYDPGRYYWVAGWSLLLGDGIISTRLACTFFQVLGVGVALLALRRAGVRLWLVGVAGVIITFWMVERFKLFEQCVALIALYPAVRLIQRPNKANALIAGVFIGLAAVMGRNHGFYNTVAFGALLVLLAYKYRRPELLKLTLPLGCGIVLGYLPILLMMAFVPGFYAAFIDSVITLAHAKATNLTIPVPWPWRFHPPETANVIIYYYSIATMWCFVLLAGGFGIAAVVIALLPGSRWREQAGLMAASVIGIPYMHYAFSRADTPHLAHSMPLLVITLLLLPGLLRRAPDRRAAFLASILVLGMLTFFATFISDPIFVGLTAGRKSRHDISINGDALKSDARTAALVVAMQHFAQTVLAPGEKMLITPAAPLLYEVIGRPSPVQELYFLWPPPPDKEQETIRELDRQHINWTLLNVEKVDNMTERSLPSTHPLLVQYLREHFQPIPNSPVTFPYVLLRRTNPLPSIQP